jgi:phage-related minor tail protein
MEVIEKLDIALDLLVLALGAALIWRMSRILSAIRDVIANVDSASAREKAAREKADALNEEYVQHMLADFEQRLRALEDRVNAIQPKPDH